MKTLLLNIILASPRETAKYKELLADPEKAKTSNRYGIKALATSLFGVVFAALTILFAVLAKNCSDQVGKQWFAIIGMILCIAVLVVFALYALLMLLFNFRFVRWQKKLNQLKIGTVAMTVNCVALVAAIALIVIAALLFFL